MAAIDDIQISSSILFEKGFTFLELVVVLVITAVIGSYVSVSINKSIQSNQLQKTSYETMKQLSSIRPIALKNDARMLVKFSTLSCSVFVDKNSDTVGQAEEFSSCWKMNRFVSMGLPPKTPPVTAPAGSALPQSGKVAAGQWAKGFLVTNDALGTINPGCVYLHSPKLAKSTYCITSFTSQSLKIFSWNGKSWIAL